MLKSLGLPFTIDALLAKLYSSKQHKDIMFAIGVLCIISVLIFPISPRLLDFLLCISIAISVLILMTVLFIDRPLDFSAFPSLLLVVTMLRLALNVSTTRLILANGEKGTSAAGHVVEAFGYFVMQGSVVIGAIVFIILTIINFIVITKGSTRIAEVAARFSLDAMPGKQMSIDADLSAGLISEDAARAKRKDLEDENTFFGAMDGANKFVRGDAIAGILITFINFVAGIIIGMVQQSMSFDKALQTYTILTIGDGLVSQIPALIVSTGAGLLVTKSGAHGSADKAILEQLSRFPQALGVSGGLIGFMSLMPGIPFFPFAIVASSCALTAYFLQSAKTKLIQLEENKKDIPKTPEEIKASSEKAIMESLHIDYIRLEFGYELLPLINYEKGHRITDQIKALRNQLARDLGFIIPSVRIQDNMQLLPNTYIIKIKDLECGRGEARAHKIMIMDPKAQPLTIEGDDTIEPAFGLPARWVDESCREEAVFKEYTVVDPITVIITHLTEVVKENITELLTYSETQKLLDNLSSEHKKLAADIIPSQITVVTLQRILQSLLNESVSIRDLPSILESISEMSGISNNITRLSEHIRSRLSKQICLSNANENGFIPFVILSSYWEQIFMDSIVGDNDTKQFTMSPSKLHEFVLSVNKEFEKQAEHALDLPVILTSAILRPFVRSVIERFRPSIVVMSQNEIYAKVKIKTVGQI